MPTKTFSFSLKEDQISERRTSLVGVALFRRPDRDETPVFLTRILGAPLERARYSSGRKVSHPVAVAPKQPERSLLVTAVVEASGGR